MMTKYMQKLALSALMIMGVGCGGVEFGEEVPVSEAELEIGETEQALFSNCRNTTIRISNQRYRNGSCRKIKVVRAEYYSASRGRWYSENLADRVIPCGQTGVWGSEDLQYVQDELITKWKPIYRIKELDGDWSGLFNQVINTPDRRCRAGDTFSMTIR